MVVIFFVGSLSVVFIFFRRVICRFVVFGSGRVGGGD